MFVDCPAVFPERITVKNCGLGTVRPDGYLYETQGGAVRKKDESLEESRSAVNIRTKEVQRKEKTARLTYTYSARLYYMVSFLSFGII
jgi:hypothetical protein